MYKRFIKRLLDLVLALIGLPFFGLLFLILAPVIYLTDKGPVFYTAPRFGKDGRTFRMYKFRSMKVNAPDLRNADGSTYNGANDPRVTKIDRIMRKTSLDEIPQILNVLKGDMSLVGPRAFLGTDKWTYNQMDAKRQKRLSVRPGITGYSQAYYRNSIGLEEKIEYDCYYVDHLSFLLDVKVLLKTAVSVLKHENIYVKTGEDIPAQRDKQEVSK
ncbi:MAG: sugar transferase [Clostridia bacterium]|nr:sugar transferase [Clostridia bacterium]